MTRPCAKLQSPHAWSEFCWRPVPTVPSRTHPLPLALTLSVYSFWSQATRSRASTHCRPLQRMPLPHQATGQRRGSTTPLVVQGACGQRLASTGTVLKTPTPCSPLVAPCLWHVPTSGARCSIDRTPAHPTHSRPVALPLGARL
jgi:hypothetical protein